MLPVNGSYKAPPLPLGVKELWFSGNCPDPGQPIRLCACLLPVRLLGCLPDAPIQAGVALMAPHQPAVCHADETRAPMRPGLR